MSSTITPAGYHGDHLTHLVAGMNPATKSENMHESYNGLNGFPFPFLPSFPLPFPSFVSFLLPSRISRLFVDAKKILLFTQNDRSMEGYKGLVRALAKLQKKTAGESCCSLIGPSV